MFKDLRTGSPFYILYKNEPRLAVAEVKSVSKPMLDFNMPYQQGTMMQPTSYVEANLIIDGQDVLMQKVPAELSMTDYGADMVISDNDDAMTNEIRSLMRVSEKHVADTPKHEHKIAEYSSMLETLNPSIAKATEQEKKIEKLTSDFSEVKARIDKLTEILERGFKSE